MREIAFRAEQEASVRELDQLIQEANYQKGLFFLMRPHAARAALWKFSDEEIKAVALQNRFILKVMIFMAERAGKAEDQARFERILAEADAFPCLIMFFPKLL